ncbi:MAG: hypothetical protein HY903_19480 [Deltaproteobacteria bacterium]|nr:hypothetical protein [Deltaproteobacteria bacterium]
MSIVRFSGTGSTKRALGSSDIHPRVIELETIPGAVAALKGLVKQEDGRAALAKVLIERQDIPAAKILRFFTDGCRSKPEVFVRAVGSLKPGGQLRAVHSHSSAGVGAAPSGGPVDRRLFNPIAFANATVTYLGSVGRVGCRHRVRGRFGVFETTCTFDRPNEPRWSVRYQAPGETKAVTLGKRELVLLARAIGEYRQQELASGAPIPEHPSATRCATRADRLFALMYVMGIAADAAA